MVPFAVLANPVSTDVTDWEAELEAQIEAERAIGSNVIEDPEIGTSDSEVGPTIPCQNYPNCDV